MWPCLVEGEGLLGLAVVQVWRLEEEDHRLDCPLRTLEASRLQLEALDQSLLEVLEGKNRMFAARSEDLKVREEWLDPRLLEVRRLKAGS